VIDTASKRFMQRFRKGACLCIRELERAQIMLPLICVRFFERLCGNGSGLRPGRPKARPGMVRAALLW